MAVVARVPQAKVRVRRALRARQAKAEAVRIRTAQEDRVRGPADLVPAQAQVLDPDQAVAVAVAARTNPGVVSSSQKCY